MTHPEVIVTVDGVPVSGVFFERLVSLNVIDREGIRSDALEMVFSDDAPRFASPRRGAIVQVLISTGGLGGVYSGAFVIDQVEFNCLPYTLSVSGHSADLRSEMKARRARHWDDTSVKDIVTEIAGQYGLEAKISDAVSGYVYEWIGQQDESDLNFLERMATRNGALFTIKSGRLLWLERGAGKTASGESIPVAIIAMPDIIAGSCRVAEADVDRFATVKAYFQDRAGAARKVIEVDGDPEAFGEHTLPTPYASNEEAELAAKAYAAEMLRGSVTTSCSIIGRPNLMAGQPVIYAGVRAGVDGRAFILETVKHSFSKSGGLRTMFSGKLQAGA